jgi:two-component system sensor histidine kinase GlrK
MSLYAIIQLSEVRNVTHAIILVDNYLIDFQKKLTDALLSETRYEKKYVIMKDKALHEGFLQAKSDFEKHLKDALTLDNSVEVRNLLEEVGKLHNNYQILFSEEMEYLKSGKQYPRVWFSAEKEKVANNIVEDLKTLRLSSEENIFGKILNLSEAGTRARTVAMVMTAASLLFGVVLAVFITRSITVPLSQMKMKTREIAQGVYGADLSLSSPPEIEELTRAFNFMCNKLKEVDKMKSDFFSLMSHELRTPLTSINEGTNLFLEGHGGEVTEKQKKLLSIISEESNRLIKLVNSLLDLSKMEAGMLAYNFSESQIDPLIHKAIVEVIPLALARKIKIEKQVGDLRPVRMDTERILQVLRNLLGNALKFTPNGGLIAVSARLAEEWVEVSVADTGPGIPEEHLSTIFDKFRQVDPKKYGSFKGTGLGLAIAKHIVTKHGGRIWIESAIGKGSTFFFALPA